VFAAIAIYGHSDHKTDITIEFTSKIRSKTYITLMCLPLLPYMVTPITKRTSPLNSHRKTTPEHIEHLCVCHYCHIWSLRSQNGHHHWIHIKNPLQNIYNTYVFAAIAIYGYSDHKMDITIEFTSKNHSRTYRTLMLLPLLPYMVTPITKRTSPLNSHRKTTPEHIEHLCFCRYCHIWALRSQNRHHHWIHIEKLVQDIYHMSHIK